MKKFLKIMSVMAGTLLTFSMFVLPAAAVSDSGKANRNNPVKAENVEIVKKVTLKGAAGKPAKGTGLASTGIKGETITGTKYAIVIGISDYTGTASDLQYADDDATEMKNVLETAYGFNANNITLLTDKAGTRSAIFNKVKALKTIMDSDDELVFFFSGHGAKGRAADGDINNTDQSIVVCKENDMGFDYIWDGELKTLFSDSPTNHLVFIFDSCLSGGMSVLKSTGRVINMACTASGVSYEGGWGGGHGQFTYYFAIDGMGSKAAESPLDSDVDVTVEEAFDYAKANCQWQTPTIADGFLNDLLP